jgi:hypothetical protein
MAGHAAHTPRRGIMNFSILNFIGRSQARMQGLRWVKAGVLHTQGPENMIPAVEVEGLSRNPSNELAQDDEVEIAV